MLTWFLVAIGLAADAFAVSVSNGICVPDLKPRVAARAALAFGLFQFGMPLLGWALGGAFRSLIQGFDHWIAFGLLAFVGGKMLKEGIEAGRAASCDDGGAQKGGILAVGTLLVLAVATSIDALAVGLSYRMIGERILAPAAVIGAVTFCLSFVGVEFGKRIGERFERWAEIAGGAILVGIGLKILAEHLA